MREFILGIVLILTSGTGAIFGVVSGEPALVIVGLSILAAVLTGELASRVRPTCPSIPELLLRRRRERNALRATWFAHQLEHRALAESIIAAADFHSWRNFYDADSRRRTGETPIREVADGEFVWRIIWIATNEVVAWPFRWQDERMHRMITSSTYLRTPTPSLFGFGPIPTPDAIYLIGHSCSAEQCREHIASASTLADIRDALAPE